MDSQKFLNKYISSLAEQVKSLTMEKTMLTTQLALAQEEIEELKKQLPTQSPSDQNQGQWHQ